jgi:hypothetical protein
LRLGHNFIGTEHLLLGIIREGSDTGYQILEEMVAGGTHTVYGQVMMLLNGYKSDPPEYETTENSLEGMRKTLTGIRQNVDSLIEHIDTMQQRKDTA